MNQTISNLTVDRDGTQFISVSGQLRFAANGTPAPNVRTLISSRPLQTYRSFPVQGSDTSRLVGEAVTDGNGSFLVIGFPGEPSAPGMHNIVVEHRQSGYVSNDAVVYDGYVNVTDNTTIEHTAPLAINSPVVGAGATTVIEGRLSLFNPTVRGNLNLPNQTVWLTYTSAVDGLQNFSAEADSSGSWTISLNLERKRTQGQPVCDPWVFWMARHLRSRKQPSAVPLAAFNHPNHAQRHRCTQLDSHDSGPTFKQQRPHS